MNCYETSDTGDTRSDYKLTESSWGLQTTGRELRLKDLAEADWASTLSQNREYETSESLARHKGLVP